MNWIRHTTFVNTGHLAMLVAFAAVSAAHAGRPLQAEDAGVLDRGGCEIEGSAQQQTDPTAPRAMGETIQVACGVGGTSQIALAAQRQRAGSVSVHGIRLGGKSELWRGGGDLPAAFTVAWGLTTSRLQSGAWQHSSTDVLGVLSLPLPGATMHLNLGHSRDEIAGEPSMTWAIAYEHVGFGPWAPMVELFGSDRGAPSWNAGLRFTALPEKLYFDLSYGRQMATGQPRLMSAGVKFSF